MMKVKAKLNFTNVFQPILCQDIQRNLLAPFEVNISAFKHYRSFISDIPPYFVVDVLLIDSAPAPHSNDVVRKDAGRREGVQELSSRTTVPLIRDSCHSYATLCE